MFPSTLRYIETITNPEGLFQTIGQVEAVMGSEGQPIYSSGNFGTVFKIKTSLGTKALKCFTRHQAGRLAAYVRIAEALSASDYIVDYKYLDQEIYVFDDMGEGEYHPVLLMDWVEGQTLSREIDRAILMDDSKRIKELTGEFKKMSEWLLAQTFAHNDIKPDNIMIRHHDSQMVLVDYDGMFVESMAGEQAREFGTEPFQSPNRATLPFDRNIDNYSLAYINKALEILCDNPNRYSATSLVEFTDQERAQIENRSQDFDHNFQYLGTSSSEGIMVYKEEGRYGFIKSESERLCEAQYDRVLEFSDSLAAVCSNKQWGFIDTKGRMVINQIYNECTSFCDSMAAVRVGSKWGYINREGQSLSRFAYDNAWSPRQGLALVCRGGRYGFLGPDGRVAISLKYDFAQNFTPEGVACVKLGDRYGYINRQGRWWARPMYDHAQNFRNGIAAVELNGREFFINFEQ